MKDLKTYEDLSGNSGVKGYRFLSDGISLQFRHKQLYLYDFTKSGKQHVEEMKALAVKGIGLTSYINQKVRKNYRKKLK